MLAADFASEAADLVNKGETDEALNKIRISIRLNPDEYEYLLLESRILLEHRNYQEAIIRATELLIHPSADARAHRILANSLDMNGDSEKAEEILLEGLEKFPDAGALYLELGILAYANALDQEAAAWWEKGVRQDPGFGSNYYWLSKYYSTSAEPVRSLIYGEIFLNIDRISPRCREISRLLFHTWSKCIQKNDEGVISLKFSEQADTSYRGLDKKQIRELNFESAVTFTWYMVLINPFDQLDISTLHKKRTSFEGLWEDLFSEVKPNELFEWHRILIDEGHFESYNYWLFYDGNPAEYQFWLKDHKNEYRAFEDWFVTNPMPVGGKNRVDHRTFTGDI